MKYFILLLISIFGLSGCSTPHFLSNTFSNANPPLARDAANLTGFPNNPVFWQDNNPLSLWGKLQRIPLTQLQTALLQTSDANIISWLKLAIISKQYSMNAKQLATQLITWRAANPSHPANALFPDDAALNRLQNLAAPKHLALLLPLQGSLANSGQAVREGFLNAYYETLAVTKQQQIISFYDTSQNSSISALYQQALTEGADSIIGPLTKTEVQNLLQQSHFPAPTLALNYTEVSFSSLPNNVFEFGLSPIDEARQLAEKARQAQHTRALIIAPEDEWGQRVVKTLTANWKALGGTVSDTFYFTPQTNLTDGIAHLLHIDPAADREKMTNENNKTILARQRRQDIDVIFLLALPDVARQIVPLLKYYYAENIPVFSTSVIYSGTPEPQRDFDLNGVIFCDTPWILRMASMNTGLPNDHRFNRLYALGKDAYALINQYPRMQELTNFPLYGATGALTLTAKQQIYRRLAWTRIHDGRP